MNNRITFLFIFMAISLCFASNDPIKEIISKVNIDTLFYFVECLSGEREVEIDGKKVTITNRSKGSVGNTHAEKFIAQTLEKYKLTAKKHEYSSTGTNVYAIQKGKKSNKFIFCGHYDCVQCPGADDNASATAAVLEAARILSKYSVTNDVQYALWDEEEQYLVGSLAYAKQAKSSNELITGVINMDMLGYDGNNDGKININHKEGTDKALLNKTLQIQKEYDIKIDPVVPSKPGPSDHTAFWQNGFNAIGVEEDWNGKDQNPNYHKAGDKISAFNKQYFHEFTKLMIGTLAALAGTTNPTPISIVHTSQQKIKHYITFSPLGLILNIPSSGYVSLSIINAQGQSKQIHNAYHSKGQIHIPRTNNQYTHFTQGFYIYILELNNSFLAKKKLMHIRK